MAWSFGRVLHAAFDWARISQDQSDTTKDAFRHDEMQIRLQWPGSDFSRVAHDHAVFAMGGMIDIDEDMVVVLDGLSESIANPE